jgi:hypothetical protein
MQILNLRNVSDDWKTSVFVYSCSNTACALPAFRPSCDRQDTGGTARTEHASRMAKLQRTTKSTEQPTLEPCRSPRGRGAAKPLNNSHERCLEVVHLRNAMKNRLSTNRFLSLATHLRYRFRRSASYESVKRDDHISLHRRHHY